MYRQSRFAFCKGSIFVFLLVTCVISASAEAGTKVVEKRTMSFTDCILSIQRVATELGVAPINIVETSELRIVRFPTNDGSGDSILVTCSGPDRLMLINLTTID